MAADTPTPPVASSVRQEVADRNELGSLVVWLRTDQQTMPGGCSKPWLAALERILDHIDAFGGMRYVER